MNNDVTWRWAKGVSLADVTSLEKAKRWGWTQSAPALEERFPLSFMHLDWVSGEISVRTVTFMLISEVVQSL